LTLYTFSSLETALASSNPSFSWLSLVAIRFTWKSIPHFPITIIEICIIPGEWNYLASQATMGLEIRSST
jgi:hypothetical protein